VATPTQTVPRNSGELEEMLHDPKKRGEILASEKSLTDFITAYGEQQQGEGTDLNRLVAEETQKQLAAYLKDKDVDNDNADRIKRLNLDPQNKGRGGKASMLTSYGQGAAHNAHAPGAVLDGKFETAVDYLNTIWHLNNKPDVQAKLAEIRNAASSVSPADGGFLVPEVLRSQLLQISLEKSVVRPQATVVPMDSARVPFPTIDVTSNASSVFGGMVAYWGEESAALTDANPKFGRVELDAKKLTGLSVVPNELLQDSIISFSALIERLWPMTLAFEEDSKFMTGTGVGEPLGFLGSANPASDRSSRRGRAAVGDDRVRERRQHVREHDAESLNNAVWIIPGHHPAAVHHGPLRGHRRQQHVHRQRVRPRPGHHVRPSDHRVGEGQHPRLPRRHRVRRPLLLPGGRPAVHERVQLDGLQVRQRPDRVPHHPARRRPPVDQVRDHPQERRQLAVPVRRARRTSVTPASPGINAPGLASTRVGSVAPTGTHRLGETRWLRTHSAGW
jgi:HK97 family phage major capsid protein